MKVKSDNPDKIFWTMKTHSQNLITTPASFPLPKVRVRKPGWIRGWGDCEFCEFNRDKHFHEGMKTEMFPSGKRINLASSFHSKAFT